MKSLKYLGVVFVLMSVPNVAIAQDSSIYGSIGVTTYELDTLGANAKLGYSFNEYFGVEAEGIIGISGTTETIGVNQIEFKTDYTIAAFVIARLPVSEQVDLFLRGGYHQTGVSLSAIGTLLDGDFDGGALGGGIQYNFSSKSGIRAEYTYLGGSFANFNAVSLGYVRKF
ncbi:MAG: porin family protein [Robiginitomaculum sp.]|nr:porin family protein [Robiginitomaculum sp.]